MQDEDQIKDNGSQITDEDKNVQEGEIVSESDTIVTADVPAGQDNSSATILESLESLIKENLTKVDTLSKELGEQKEMLDSVLRNDETYVQHAEAAKTAAKVKTGTKNEILKRPENVKVNQKVKDLASEIKEIGESMGSYLAEYQRLSGSNEIEMANGEVFQIVNQPKLIRRKG